MKKVILLLLISISVHAQTTILSEDFSGVTIPTLPLGWNSALIPSYIPTAPIGWVTVDTTLQFYSNFVPVVPPQNKYVAVFDWGAPYDSVATLTTRMFSLGGTSQPYLSLDYYYLEGNNSYTISTAEKSWVNISTDGGSSWATIDTIHASGFVWASKYINLSSYAGATTVSLQFVYSDNGQHMYGCALDNIEVFDAAPYDLALTKVTPADGDPAKDYFLPGAGTSFGGTVLNHGTSSVSSFVAGYQVGSGAPATTTISGVFIPPFTTYSFTITPPYTVSSSGRYPVKVWVKEASDTNSTNDSMATVVYGATKWPHKNVLFEECTGTWCGYCVRGIVYMDSLWKVYDTSVNIVAVHDQNDPMDSENVLTQDYATFVEDAAQFANPTIYIDRMATTDPTYAFTEFASFNQNFGLADMNVAVKQAGSSLDVTATVTPATSLEGDYRLQLILTEDNVHSKTGSYAQKNYYSYMANNEPLFGVGYNFQDSVDLIPASSMYYNFVARYIIPDPMLSPNGMAGSLPAVMNAGTVYSYTFKGVSLSADWIAKNIKVTAILINNINGYVYNSVHATLPPLAVSQLNESPFQLNIFPNPVNDIMRVSLYMEQSQQLNLKIYDVLGRVAYVTSIHAQAGDQVIKIPVGSLYAGVYSLLVETTTDNEASRFVIEK